MKPSERLTVNELLYVLDGVRSQYSKCKRLAPILQRAVATIDDYEEENKSLREQLEQLKASTTP